ncbi:MAG: endonuclease/exonuclease/phosphatase family protein, partial [Planctomycetales bacterium]|nr:endonuclease/exonuclease/phosphatase family protein [Planctomycetales bacterium]
MSSSRWFWIWTLLIVGCVLAGLIVHLIQADAWAALSFVPPVLWWLVAAVAAGPMWLRGQSWQRRTLAAGLFIYALFAVEEVSSLGRWAWHGFRLEDSGPRVRIVSLNCNVGSSVAAREVLALNPDVVLLQESPGEAAVWEVAWELFGEEAAVVYGRDCSIVARGRLEAVDDFPNATGTAAIWTMPDDRPLRVVSLRLAPPVIRIDYWSSDCWRDYAAVRRKHREQLRAIVKATYASGSEAATVIGGDFNLPARDGALDVMPDVMADAFRTAGRGWGNTALNQFPVARPDQVWCSRQLAVT